MPPESFPYRVGEFSTFSIPELRGLINEQIAKEARAPEDYVISKFNDHDIVFMGEAPHKVDQNAQFLVSLIPRLYAAGVRNLGYEFVHSDYQAQVDKLINAKKYDEALANKLVFEWGWEEFGAFEGYRDVLRAAWEVNSKLPAGAPRFKIVALDVLYKFSDPAQLRPGEKATDLSAMRRRLGLRDRDVHWAELIEANFVNKGEKALIYSGAGHSMTRFQWDRGKPSNHHQRTAGNLIYQLIGERAFRIDLHGSEGTVVAQLIDSIVNRNGPHARFGMDVTARTPFGDMPSDWTGYIPKNRNGSGSVARSGSFVLSDVTDGYVYLAPMSQWRMQKRVPGMYTPEAIKEIVKHKQADTGKSDVKVTLPELLELDEAEDRLWKSQWEWSASAGE